MARIGQLFGRRNAAVVDRDRDGVDDRRRGPHRSTTASTATATVSTTASRTAPWTSALTGTATASTTGSRRSGSAPRTAPTGSPPSAPCRVSPPDTDTDRDGIADHRETHTTTMKPVIDREPSPPTSDAVAVPVEPGRPARASLLSTLGLVVGVVAVATALTGLLATWAFPLGALGLLLSFGGIIAGARRHVAGRGIGTLGVLFSGTAVVFAILALTGQVSWLDSDVDQVARLNEWLDAQFPWMKDW